jgi:1,4-dihydroxy-6-naphthoate synthase
MAGLKVSSARGAIQEMPTDQQFEGKDAEMPRTSPRAMENQAVSLAHSPDSDDAFMFYALATNKVRAPGMKISHVLSDIESLNLAAQTEKYDVTAVSFSAYPLLAEKYALLDCGSSVGDGYGPLVVAARGLKADDLAGRRIGVPGLLTTSYLALRLFEPRCEPVPMPFDKIMEAVSLGTVEAGLLIHEGQLMFSRTGLLKVIDLGIWWKEQTGLPLPLGGNAVRRALGRGGAEKIARVLRESVAYALEHRDAALNYAMQFARSMDYEVADKFVGMYVNQWTLSLGDIGRRAVRELLARGHAAGLIPSLPEIEFLGIPEAASAAPNGRAANPSAER